MEKISINHVCGSRPYCKCVGHKTEWDECDCTYVGFARCKHCRAPMRKIDVSTGEDVVEYCDAKSIVTWVPWEDGRSDDR